MVSNTIFIFGDSPVTFAFSPSTSTAWEQNIYHSTGMAAFNPVMSAAPAEGQMQRPSMRRKSSAQNLLTSFKPNSTTQTSTVSSATGLHFVSAMPTPTGAGSMSREADVQSLQSESVASTTLTNGSSATAHGTSVEMLRELVKKRIITLTYLRNVHEGCVYFHVIRRSLIRFQAKSLVSYNNDIKTRTRPRVFKCCYEESVGLSTTWCGA